MAMRETDPLENACTSESWFLQRSREWSFPNPTEQAFVEAITLETRTTLDAISLQRSQAAAHELERLDKKREAFESHLLSCTSLLAPIRRLPPDLLIEVFLWYDLGTKIKVDGGYNIPSEPVEVHCPAISLLWVCSAWSKLAADTPLLWNKVSVEIAAYNPNKNIELDNGLPVSPTEHWLLHDTIRGALAKTRNCPLDIAIEIFSISASWQLQCILPLLEESCRWKSLRLGLEILQDVPFDLLDLHFSVYLPILEILEINARIWDTGPRMLGWFSNAPKLQIVEQVSTETDLCDLPWGQLESLSMSDVFYSADLHMDIVEKAKSLRRLQCDLGYSLPNSDQRTRMPKRPLQVSTLKLQGHDDCAFFRVFSFPQLSELTLGFIPKDGEEVVEKTAAQIKRLDIEPRPEYDAPSYFSHCLQFLFDAHIHFPNLTNIIFYPAYLYDGDPGPIPEIIPSQFWDRFPKLVGIVCYINHDDHRFCDHLSKVTSVFKASTAPTRNHILLRLSSPLREELGFLRSTGITFEYFTAKYRRVEISFA